MNRNKLVFLGSLFFSLVFLFSFVSASTAISNCAQLQAMGLSGSYHLTDNIDCSGITNFIPIGSTSNHFTGTFDGNYYEITDLTITRTNDAALFSTIGSMASVKNVGLINVNIHGSNTNAAALAGYNYGVIRNCYSTGSVSGNQRVGGLVGTNWPVLTGPGEIHDSYSRANVDGSLNVGGLVGFTVHGGMVYTSYSTGTATASWKNANGLVGLKAGDGDCVNCYFDKYTSHHGSTYCGVATTTLSMKIQSTFAGWDFTNTWAIDPSGVINNGYPYLRGFEHVFIDCTDSDNDHYYLESSGCDGEVGFLGHSDCVDSDALNYPGNSEVCNDGNDNDCDTNEDCDDSECSGFVTCVYGSTDEVVEEWIDDSIVVDVVFDYVGFS